MRRLFPLLAASLCLLVSPPATSCFALIWPVNGKSYTVPLRFRKPTLQTAAPGVPSHSNSLLRNTQRRKDVTNIGGAIFSYRRDNHNAVLKMIPLDSPTEICRDGAKSCSGLVDMTPFKKYLTTDTVPRDPQAPAQGNGTRYFVYRDYTNAVFVTAPDAETGWVIKVQK